MVDQPSETQEAQKLPVVTSVKGQIILRSQVIRTRAQKGILQDRADAFQARVDAIKESLEARAVALEDRLPIVETPE